MTLLLQNGGYNEMTLPVREGHYFRGLHSRGREYELGKAVTDADDDD